VGERRGVKMQSRLAHLGKKTIDLLIWILGTAMHGVVLWVLYRNFLPIVEWYWNSIPTRGVDLHNGATYLAYLGSNFSWLPQAWKYIFFNGEPLIIDYPSLHFYLSVPFLQWFTPVRAIQFWMLISTFLFFVFSYLLYARLSKSRWLAMLLSVLTIYSVNVYGALIWGGSIPYHGTQFFLPLTLYLLICYFQTGRLRWFAGSVLALGISQYGHSQVALSYGLVLSVLSLLLFPRAGGVGIKKRIVEVFGFLLLVFLIGFPVTSSRLGALGRVPDMISTSLTGELPVSYQATPGPNISDEVRQFYRTRIYHFYTDTNPWLFWIGGAALGLLLAVYLSFTLIRVLSNRRKSTPAIYAVLWATILLAYTAGYLYLYSIGIDIFHGGWFRVFWPVPMLVGLFTAVAVGGILDIAIGERKGNFFRIIWLVVDGIFVALIILLLPGQYNQEFENTLYGKSVASGGFPGTILVSVNEEEQRQFAYRALPDWVDSGSRNYRLYSSNQVYNMWFNSYFDLPLARGYIDPTITNAQRWGIFLMDIALDNNVAVEEFGYPEEMAKNAAKFVIDWNSIRYLAGEAAGTGSTSLTNFSSYLISEDFMIKDERWETLGGRLAKPDKIIGDVYVADIPNYVRYLEVREDLVSPILSLSNAPSMLFVGDESMWEIFIRTLAQMGITSRELIPVKGPKFLDKVSLNDLDQFEAVMLYGYDYKNHGKAWIPLEKFVDEGGVLFVDTGAEVKESDSLALPASFSKDLPPIFPIKATERGDLGSDWNIEADSELGQINFGEFAPLLYDMEPWNVSFARSESVDEEAEVLLSLSGYPVIVSWQYGEGSVIWSGLNLPAHMERYRDLEESKLLRVLLSRILSQREETDSGDVEFKSDFISSERRAVSGSGTRGVLFKESNFPGWTAGVKSELGSRKLEIWRAGLGYPGLMWARIPPEFEGRDVEVEFIFRGAGWMWIKFIFSSIIGIVLFDKFVFNGKIFGRASGKALGYIRRKFGAWWEREEE
jgi:hypothetical protein